MQKFRLVWIDAYGKKHTTSGFDSEPEAENFLSSEETKVSLTRYQKFPNNSGRPRYGSGKHRGA